MKTNIAITLLAFFLGGTFAVAQSLAPKDGSVQLPSVSAIKIEKVLYQFASRAHLMGDGHRAYVAEVNGDDLTRFIKTSIPLDPKWSHGSMQKYGLYLQMLEWIERSMVAHKTTKEFGKVVNLSKLKLIEGLYMRAEYKRNDDGDFTDATLWIILPDKNLIIMLNENT